MEVSIGTMPERREVAPASPRVGERAILRLGIAITGSFLLASVLSALLPLGGLHGWVATHLALGGAATVSIGTFMPHFGVTLAGTRPEPWPLRLAGVIALAGGMATVALGRPLVGAGFAAGGGLLVLAGIGLTAWTTFAPMRSSLARRHLIVRVCYAVALADAAVAASLATLLVVGWPPVAGAWLSLKPAHAWLNVFGFVSLTTATTLVYLYPTMLGARILRRRSLAVALPGLVIGPPLTAAGYATAGQPLAVAGASLTLLGAAGFLWYGLDTWRRRGNWARDLAWHELAARHGLGAMCWFVLACDAALAGPIRDGVVMPGWTLGDAGGADHRRLGDSGICWRGPPAHVSWPGTPAWRCSGPDSRCRSDG